MICGAQEQALRTNFVRYHIDKTNESLMCRLCGACSESVCLHVLQILSLQVKLKRQGYVTIIVLVYQISLSCILGVLDFE